MPIKGLSEVKRLPRVGKIRLGYKKKSAKTGAEYPVATTYFVCPPEVRAIYGEEPKRLEIIIPVEDDELWASQYYRQYSRSRGLICKGDGITCRRMIDTESGDLAVRETKTVKWEEGAECLGRDCPHYKRNACQEVMILQVMLPKVPGLGVWQIDTGSINSIRNINDCATMIRAICGRVSWVPLTLTLEPTEVVNPDDGKKKTVYCMHLRQEKGMAEILEASNRPRAQLLITAPLDNEAPEDKILNAGTDENAEELNGKAGDDIETYWPKEPQIIEGTVVENKAPEKKAETNPIPEPTQPKTVKELMEAVSKHGKQYSTSWVLKNLNYAGTNEIHDPAGCYLTLKELAGWES